MSAQYVGGLSDLELDWDSGVVLARHDGFALSRGLRAFASCEGAGTRVTVGWGRFWLGWALKGWMRG
jgi:hypothetical protein